MAAPVTTNVKLRPNDGWVLLTSNAPTAFLRLSKIPHHIPVYLAWGSSPPTLVGANATGTVTFTTGVPTASQTITIGSEVYTFVALRAAPFQVTIGGSNLLTAVNFAAAVNLDSQLVSASNTTGTVTITSVLQGTVGNYALTKTASNVTLSGVAMTGGTDVAAGFRWDCGETYFQGAITGNTYARIQTNNNDKVIVSVMSN